MYRSPLDETSTGLMLFTILELLKTDELGLPDPQNIDVGLSLFPKARVFQISLIRISIADNLPLLISKPYFWGFTPPGSYRKWRPDTALSVEAQSFTLTLRNNTLHQPHKTSPRKDPSYWEDEKGLFQGRQPVIPFNRILHSKQHRKGVILFISKTKGWGKVIFLLFSVEVKDVLIADAIYRIICLPQIA